MTNPTIKIGKDVLEITNPNNIQPVSADLFTECRQFNGIVCISFAAIITEGEAKPRAETVARIRLTLTGAADLRNSLEQILKAVMPGKETAN